MKYLFLDDIRMPEQVANYTNEHLVPMYNNEKWEIVRNYKEFVDWILKNGLPNVISFDHDLADEHYAPEEYWDEKYAEYQEMMQFKEKTGYDCAKWLCDFCLYEHLSLPTCYVHSMNPVGANNIREYLKKFKTHQFVEAIQAYLDRKKKVDKNVRMVKRLKAV